MTAIPAEEHHMSTSTYDEISRRLDSDPWRPRENLHPLTGRRVRYMGTEWAWQGTEWIVREVDSLLQAHCLQEGDPADMPCPARFPVSMLDPI
jgi:hypothetical protein